MFQVVQLVTLITLIDYSAVLCSELSKNDPQAVFWDKNIDDELSRQHVFAESDWTILKRKIRTQNVIKLERGCGRPKNMLAVLEDGTRVCCRYREHQMKELRGEIYSYFFNKFLNLWNAPPSVLVLVDFSSEQWKMVAAQAQEVGWKHKAHIVMTFYVESISEVFIPSLLKDKNVNLTQESIQKAALSQKEIVKLAQWSDFILHDFIIGHTDRLFNTLFNLQWNSKMMDMSVHNLKQTSSGKLVLLDNESGFWMGYSLQEWDPMKYEFQIYFLKRLCLFRKSTVERITRFTTTFDHGSKTADQYFEHFINSQDHYSFSTLPKLTNPFRHEFRTRISTVLNHIQSCTITSNQHPLTL